MFKMHISVLSQAEGC